MAGPARPVSDASALLQENTWPPAGTGAGAAAAPGLCSKAIGNQKAPGAAREFGTPVDGSAVAGGLAPQHFGQPASPSPTGFLSCQASGPASQHLGLEHRRKRPASPAVYIDDEFRDDHVRPMLSSSVGDGSTPAGAQPASADPCPDGDDTANDPDVEDKENVRPAVRSTVRAVDDSRALRDIEIDVPAEYKENPYDDIDSSEEDDDFQSENLAEHLFERVERNADDKYVFDIYVDPPARCGGA